MSIKIICRLQIERRSVDKVSEPFENLSISWERRKVFRAKAINMIDLYLSRILDEKAANKNIREGK